jgi:uncharacterized protein with HEPN domain
VSYTPPDDEIVEDILVAAWQVVDFTQGVNEKAFRSDEKTHSATIHALLIMGEAAKRLTVEFREKHPTIDWRGMAGMRDVLIHQYDRINLSRVWAVATQEVPGIVTYLERIRRRGSEQ